MATQVEATWSLPTPSSNYPFDGQMFRAYLNGSKVFQEQLTTEHTLYRFESEDGELTCKVSAMSEAEESEPTSDTLQVGAGGQSNCAVPEEGSINPAIPAPSGLDLRIGWTEI